jgi:DNA helicase-2/ATP-dependent DNA helicase PcrA
LHFEKDYPSATVVLLEQNYRSTKTIIAAANEVIKNNRERREKNLFTEKEDGDKIGLLITIDENEEAQRVAEETERLIKQGVKGREIAVLYRANFQSRALEEAFLRHGVHYHVLGTRFFERREVKDLIAWLRAALNPADIESSQRAAKASGLGIGPATFAQLFSNQQEKITGKKLEKVQGFQQALADIQIYAVTHKPSDTIKFTLTRSGLEALLKAGAEDDAERLENLKELATIALKYDQLPPEDGIWQFLAEAALVSDQDSLTADEKGVSLMTVHAAKGLEFDYVFIVGLEQDLFPHRGRDDEKGERDSEEERRLFYVALTRARTKLYLSYAQLRTIFGSKQVNLPSQFLGEISEDLLEADAGGDPYASGHKMSLIDF